MNELDIKWPEDGAYKWWAMDKSKDCFFFYNPPDREESSWWVGHSTGEEDQNPPATTGLDWKDSLRQKQPGGMGLDLSHLIPKAHVPTLRDQFAMAALTGILSSGGGFKGKEITIMSYEAADAMLKHREETP